MDRSHLLVSILHGRPVVNEGTPGAHAAAASEDADMDVCADESVDGVVDADAALDGLDAGGGWQRE